MIFQLAGLVLGYQLDSRKLVNKIINARHLIFNYATHKFFNINGVFQPQQTIACIVTSCFLCGSHSALAHNKSSDIWYGPNYVVFKFDQINNMLKLVQ